MKRKNISVHLIVNKTTNPDSPYLQRKLTKTQGEFTGLHVKRIFYLSKLAIEQNQLRYLYKKPKRTYADLTSRKIRKGNKQKERAGNRIQRI